MTAIFKMCKSQNCLQLEHSQHTHSGTNWLWSTLTVDITIKLDRIRAYPSVEARITNGVVCIEWTKAKIQIQNTIKVFISNI